MCSEYDLGSSGCCSGWRYWTMDSMRGIQEACVTLTFMNEKQFVLND